MNWKKLLLRTAITSKADVKAKSNKISHFKVSKVSTQKN